MTAPTPLVYEAFAGGPLGALIVLAGLLVIAWYAVWGDALYVRTVEALTGWWDARREARRAEYVERVVTAAEVADVIDPWADLIAQITVHPEDEVPFEDCLSCKGTGVLELPMTPTGYDGWINCPRCGGSGERVA